MTYSLVYSDKVLKQLQKIPQEARERVINALDRIVIRPYPHVARLVSSPYYRLRVGDYRVILDIQDGKLLILVIEIGHRKNIYK